MSSTHLATQPRASSSRAVLEAYLDALVIGDLDAVAAHFAEDATWALHGALPVSGTKHGREEIMAFLCSAVSLFVPGTQRFTFGDMTVEADRAVLEWRVQGIAAATGKNYDNAYCGIFVIRNGHITGVREYLDSLHAAETLFVASD